MSFVAHPVGFGSEEGFLGNHGFTAGLQFIIAPTFFALAERQL